MDVPEQQYANILVSDASPPPLTDSFYRVNSFLPDEQVPLAIRPDTTVADAMTKYGIENLVKHRKLIIPGYVAIMSGKIEEETNWQVLVGPRECSMLPKYLQEVWN